MFQAVSKCTFVSQIDAKEGIASHCGSYRSWVQGKNSVGVKRLFASIKPLHERELVEVILNVTAGNGKALLVRDTRIKKECLTMAEFVIIVALVEIDYDIYFFYKHDDLKWF